MLRAFLLVCCVVLGGCRHYYPRFDLPTACTTHNPIHPAEVNEVSCLSSIGKASGRVDVEVETVRDYVAGMEVMLDEAINQRRNVDLYGYEAAFYGNAIALVGALTESVGAVNTGLGTVLLSNLFLGRYKPGTQQLAYVAARDKVRCMGRTLAPYEPGFMRAISREPTYLLVQNEYHQLPVRTIDAVNKARTQLDAALKDVAISYTSKDDLQGLFEQMEKSKQDFKSKAEGEEVATDETQAAFIRLNQTRRGQAALSEDERESLEERIRLVTTALSTSKEDLEACLKIE